MKFEYYAILCSYGFVQCGESGAPQLFKNKRTANRKACQSYLASRGAVVVTFHATAVAAEKPTANAQNASQHFIAIKEQFPGAF